jgi:hypothetical protein
MCSRGNSAGGGDDLTSGSSEKPFNNAMDEVMLSLAHFAGEKAQQKA